MKKGNLIIFKIRQNSRPRPIVTINIVVIKQFARRVFGFEVSDPRKFLKSPDLDEVKVSIQLAKLETDMNWTKRLLWVMICGSSAIAYFS